MKCTDAPTLLKMRRTIAADKNISLKVMKSLVDCIDLIRWNHEDMSPDCECWQKACSVQPFGKRAGK